jgi:putative membrane-bound dehydrogenase-like protein
LQSRFFCEGASAGDFNRDGKMDIVSGPYWYQGPDFKKMGEVYAPEPFDKNTYSKNFLAFTDDVDGDGWTDVVVVGFPGEESWWFANPKGAEGHWARHVIDGYVGNESPAYTDLNGDGKNELIYISKSGQYGYANPDPKNPTGLWVFTPISPVSNLHRFTHGMGVGDVNDDGRMDVLDKDGWYEQPTKGTTGFWKKHAYTFAGPGGAQMFAYDVDGDGDNDIITSLAAHAYGLAWFEQVGKKDGEVEYVKHIILNEKPEPNADGIVFSQLHSLDLVDMDGDGLKDIVTGKRHWAHNGNDPDERGAAVVYVFYLRRADGKVRFEPVLVDDNSGVGTQVLATDLNGDAKPDIVVGNKLGTYYHLQTGKPAGDERAQRELPAPVDGRQAGAIPTRDGRPMNLGFETGDLTDWRVVSGLAFTKQPIDGDSVARRRPDMKSEHAGRYWLGTYEFLGDAPKGVLVSEPFLVTHPFASFLIGGGGVEGGRVEIVESASQRLLFRASARNVENLRPVVVELGPHRGKEVFLRVIDSSSGGWGHINFDDFRFHTDRPVLSDELTVPRRDEFLLAGAPAADAARAMIASEGFAVDVIAAEPDVMQPVAMTIDDRGRIWVAEAHEYPVRAPEGKGRDKILIFADEKGDGRFESRKVFAENLNLVSGIEVGYGGVFVGAAPYLLFIPDLDRDDRPDGEAAILLDGWAYQDTHETLNSFIWGPDGWLYGCHGVFTHSNVGRPGASDAEREPINAGIWRYHPVTKSFEVFAHGTSNPWGVDFNDRGQCFLTCCVIPHLFHVIQGARYQRQAGTHFNPYTFADIPTIAKHRHYVGPIPHAGNMISASAGGGHAHAGCLIYLGGVWPAKYRDQIFMNNIHGARINQDLLQPTGSGYTGDRAPDLLITQDEASQIIYLRSGPDGQVYMIDWYDMNQCHRPDINVHDRSNGRIYRVRYGEATAGRVDLSKETDAALVERQLDANDWYSRTARRILAERSVRKSLSETTRPALESMATSQADETRRLRGLWALHVTGGVEEKMMLRLFEDESPYVRGFAIQFAMENRAATAGVLAAMVRLAAEDPSPVVRAYLASAAMRMRPEDRWILLSSLVRHDDRADHNLPLLYWYAMEPTADVDASRAMSLASSSPIPLLVEFMSRRLAASGDAGLALVVEALRDADHADAQGAILRGLSSALGGKRRVDAPEGWSALALGLMTQHPEWTESVRALSAKFGDTAEIEKLKGVVVDAQADAAERREAIEALSSIKEPTLAGMLHELLADPRVRWSAIRGLANYSDQGTPVRILAVYGELSLEERRDALAVLTSRVEYAKPLLEAIKANRVPTRDIGAEQIRQLRSLQQESIDAQISVLWGTVREVAEDKAVQIARYKKMLASQEPGPADAALGRAVYVRTCATCHELFGAGSDIGPGLTGSNRRDVDYILHNVVDPSAVMAKEYQPHTLVTTDGRVLTGIIKAMTDEVITVRTANEQVELPREEIEEMTLSPKSMMPEDQLTTLSDHEIRSLVAYLASPSQTAMLATPATASLLFNGRDLTYWRGDTSLWSVEQGEIVGRSKGLDHNAFLVSELTARDFRLRFEVKLSPDAGNSGVQFRSEPIENGEMRGYQADIGAGWWGNLYEESGRGLLWEKSGEGFVRRCEWNTYEIIAHGDAVTTTINGKTSVDLHDPGGRREGVFGLQIHAGGAMEVRFRGMELTVLEGSTSEENSR